VEEAQRTRILQAMADAMAERGAAGATVSVADVIARAGISRTVFRDLFADREAALLAAFDLGVERAGRRMVDAARGETRWLDAVKAGLASLLGFVEDEPALAALCVVYSMSGGAAVLRRRGEVLGQLAAIVDQGRLQVPAGRQQPSPIIAEGVVGAVLAVVQNRLLVAERPPMMDLFGPLISMIVMPYMGPAVARRELARPAPRMVSGADGPVGETADEGAGEESSPARLTYRTARVLTAIGDYPGASNREVGERAGIVDQGQISKLLARLQAHGLIAKTDAAQARGAPNSWRLTGHGQAVVDSSDARARVRATRK
jgi:AcrR family transcriptional regulator